MARPLGLWHETGLKTCTQCAVEKPIEDFRANSKGSFTWCQECHTNIGKKNMQEVINHMPSDRYGKVAKPSL